ncbi:PR domain zinc finger protein 5-like [Ctenocephalides felis]|uniref:PR domain zinc finger protein 5-like n=1 Tax=Ctenocephalides felis TaxID=7515 RepID=UPI000E6E39AC|nr:PR domain zinc finger protein 5-like [Ctenocephalides felis]
MSMNDEAIKIEPPEYPAEDIKPEFVEELDVPDAIGKSELCSEEDETCLGGSKKSEIFIEEVVKQESYECDICNQSFAEPDQLKEHMVNHLPSQSEERPFKCEICNKTFKLSRGLNHT